MIEMFAVRREEEEADLIKHAVEMKFNWPIHSFSWDNSTAKHKSAERITAPLSAPVWAAITRWTCCSAGFTRTSGLPLSAFFAPIQQVPHHADGLFMPD